MKTFPTPFQLIRPLVFLFLVLFGQPVLAQQQGQDRVNIWELMERRDLRLSEIDAIAKRHFDVVGRVRGTGYKQYERWRYEVQFHLDQNGYILPGDYDAIQYAAATLAAPAQAGAWAELGPTYWNRSTSWNPGVGRVTSIAVFPANSNMIYVTSPGGGLWKSTQGGNQWTPLTDQNNAMMTMFSVAVHPTDASIVFAGNSTGTIFKSTDGGATWLAKSSGMGNVRKIMFDPTNTQVLFAAAANGIYKSIDGGNSWVSKLAVGTEDIECKPGDATILYASGSNVYRSLNAGETWTQLTSTNGITTSGRTLVSVSPANPLRLYAVQASGSLFGQLYRSDDGGNTFVTTVTGSPTNGTNYFGYETNGTGTTGQATYDMAMTVNPLNADEVHIAGIITWKSTNAGSSFVAETAWSLPNSIGYNHADVHVLEWVGNTIYSGSDGGIYKSIDNGDNWTELSNGLGIRQFYKIATSPTDPTMVTGGAQDNGSSVLKSSAWYDWLGADGMDCLISPLNANLIWGTSQYGSLYRSTNGGSSYSNIPNPGSGSWVTPLAIEANSNVIYGGYVGVYKSTDQGSSWTKISGSTINSNLSSLAVAPSNPNYIYASTGSGLFVTKDGGLTWSSYTLSGISVTSIAIHPTNPEKIWISSSNTTNRVLVSSNAGATFTNISADLPAIAARSIIVDDKEEEGLYVAMNIGVFYINNYLTSWVNLTDNIPQVAINEIELQKSSGKIRIGTYGRGVWERSIYSACNSQTSLTVTDISYTSATLSWTSVGTGLSYTVAYKTKNATEWITLATDITQNTWPLANLTEGTTYDWKVTATCAPGVSDIVTAQFTTRLTCLAPANLSVSSITSTSAQVSWGAVTGATGYDVDIKLTSSSTWTNKAINVTGPTFTITGLTSGNTYDWRVRSNCGALNGYSDYSLSTFEVACTDAYETNNTSATARTITIGAEIKALINTTTDQDWFKISVGNTKSTNVRVRLYNLPTNFNVYLYNANVVSVGSSENTGTTEETVIFNSLTTRTTYYILVKGDGSTSSSTCYSLLAETSATAYTDPTQCNPATGLTTTSIALTSATLTWAAAPNAVSYQVEYKLKAATDWTGSISTNTTQTSLALSGLTEATAYDWRVSVLCAAKTSTYSSVASFTTASSTCSDSYEPNNSSSAAKTISTGININGSIALSTDVDWYTISIGNTKATNIKVTLTGLPANYDVYLHDKNASATPLGSSTNGGTTNESIIFNSTTSRTTYYVRVVGVSGSSSPSCYTLRVDASATAFTSPLPVDYFLMEETPATRENIMFNVFPVPAQDELHLVFQAAAAAPVQIQLLDAVGKVMLSRHDQLTQGENQFTLDVRDYQPGFYYVRVVGGNRLWHSTVVLGPR